MQPKVSMVVPCYNKVQWISNMLNSVIAQKWDNIEVILVNDGSTDGTREMIELYAPIIKARGYELVIIDQENQGLAGAVYSGLLKMTGEYVCMPDCDDELDPEYVSAMAGWLWEHPTDHWMICDRATDGKHYSWDSSYGVDSQGVSKYEYKTLESYLLGYVAKSAWTMMIRVSYLNESKVMDGFDLEMRNVQEPQIWIPLALGRAQPVHIHKPLYIYFEREGSIIQATKEQEKRMFFVSMYDALIRRVLASKKELNETDAAILDIGYLLHKAFYTPHYPEYNESEAILELAEVYNSSVLSENRPLNVERVLQAGFSTLAQYICDKLIGRSEYKKIQRNHNGRIIAYAAFGKAAMEIKEGLLNSDICPDVYWDVSSIAGDSVGGVPVVQPDFTGLAPDDTVLMLLKSNLIIESVMNRLEETPAKDNVWCYKDIQDYLSRYHLGV